MADAWSFVRPVSAEWWERWKVKPAHSLEVIWHDVALGFCRGNGPFSALRSGEIVSALRRRRRLTLDQARDMVHEAIAKVFSRAEEGRVNDEVLGSLYLLEAYILRTAERLWLDSRRSQGRDDRRERRIAQQLPTAAPPIDQDAALDFRQLELDLSNTGFDAVERALVLGRARGDRWEEIAAALFESELAACDPVERLELMKSLSGRLRQQFRRLRLRLLEFHLARAGFGPEERALALRHASGESWGDIAADHHAHELAACDPEVRLELLEKLVGQLRRRFARFFGLGRGG